MVIQRISVAMMNNTPARHFSETLFPHHDGARFPFVWLSYFHPRPFLLGLVGSDSHASNRSVCRWLVSLLELAFRRQPNALVFVPWCQARRKRTRVRPTTGGARISFHLLAIVLSFALWAACFPPFRAACGNLELFSANTTHQFDSIFVAHVVYYTSGTVGQEAGTMEHVQ